MEALRKSEKEIIDWIKLPILLLQGSEELYVLPKELEELARNRDSP